MSAAGDDTSLPWSAEAEQGVIGALLLDTGRAWDAIAGVVKAEHFYCADHRSVFDVIASMAQASKPADVITVFEALQQRGEAETAGGMGYLNQMANSVTSVRMAHRYAEIIADKALRRSICAKADEAREIAYQPGPAADALDKVCTLFSGIERIKASRGPVRLSEAMVPRIDHWSNLEAGKITPGIPTRLPTLDRALSGGVKPGSLVVLAARTSIGKTSLATQIGINIAQQGHTTLVLSQEMSVGELVDRAMANMGRVGLGPLTTGKFENDDWTRVTEGAEAARNLPLFLDDQPALSLLDIRAKAREVQRKQGLSLVVVDYLQLIAAPTGAGDKRHHQIEQISRGLKALAKELGITVLLLSQLNRASTQRSEPDLVDLKESGAIEEDADVVILLHPKGSLPDGSLLLAAIVAKNRQGRRCRVALSFTGSTQRWVESTADVSLRSEISSANSGKNQK